MAYSSHLDKNFGNVVTFQGDKPEQPDSNSQSQDLNLSNKGHSLLGVTDLPITILSQVFRYFQHPAINQSPPDEFLTQTPWPDDDKHSIQNIRLVCWLFNDVASPLLFPVLRVGLDEESLYLAQAIMEQPYLVIGIRAIEVQIEYFLNSLASDKSAFVTYQRRKLKPIFKHHSRTLAQSIERARQGIELDPNTPVALIWSDERAPLLDNVRACLVACNSYLGHDIDEDLALDQTVSEQSLVEQFQGILNTAYESYKRKSLAQMRILKEKSLINALATLAARSGYPIALSILEKPSPIRVQDLYTDSQVIARLLNFSQRWQDVGRIPEARDDALVYNEIMWELPICIYEAGGKMKGLNLDSLFASKDYTLVCPKDRPLAMWDSFSGACQNLQIFNLQGLAFDFPVQNYDLPVLNYDPPEDQLFIEVYLKAAISSHMLKKVSITLTNSALDRLFGRRYYCPVNNTLAKVNWPYADTISISHISISQIQMEAFCQRLSQDLNEITLCHIYLNQGSWANILDIMRERLSGNCRVNFDTLSGGGIGQYESGYIWDDPISLHTSTENGEANERLMEKFMKYVKAEDAENPVRK